MICRHSGLAGDILYALPAMRALGARVILVRPTEEFPEDRVAGLLPLLAAQPHIERAAIWNGESFDVDLDVFRDLPTDRFSIADAHLLALGLPLTLRDEPWLTVPPGAQSSPTGRRVLFSRTPRYRGVPGFWHRCYELFGGAAAFIGLPEEHEEFEREVGHIPFVPTSDLLELAQVISGAELFVGNQSAAYAIAEGLKQNAILEVHLSAPNCIFGRHNALCVASKAGMREIEGFARRFLTCGASAVAECDSSGVGGIDGGLPAESLRSLQATGCDPAGIVEDQKPAADQTVPEGTVAISDHRLPVPGAPAPLPGPYIEPRTTGSLGPAELAGTSLVVVTYNSASTVGECLASVLNSLGDEDEVIVVDNDSSDGTVRAVRLFHSPKLTLLCNEENVGFSKASNQGIRASKGATIVLLNPDTVVPASWAARMRAHLFGAVAAVGPLSDHVVRDQYVLHHVLSENPVLWISEFDRLAKEQNAGRSQEVKLLTGFCLMLRRDVLDKVGLLDEDFFLGCDDLELCLRLRANGYGLVVAKDVFVQHAGHASFKTESEDAMQAILDESDRVMARKLTAMFPEGVPSSDELWGVPIFKWPDSL